MRICLDLQLAFPIALILMSVGMVLGTTLSFTLQLATHFVLAMLKDSNEEVKTANEP